MGSGLGAGSAGGVGKGGSRCRHGEGNPWMAVDECAQGENRGS